MKKNYFFGALLSLMFVLFALPAKAQVASLADLFGKYQFTADMTVTPGMDSYAEHFSNNCEVVITSDPNGIYDAQISGLAGGAQGGVHYINSFNASANQFAVYNWNNSYNPVWGGGLNMSDAEGIYPYGWGDMPQLGDLVFTFDPATKNMTLDDFTLVTVNHSASTATVVATFKNVKLTFLQGEEKEEIEVADISGEWHAKAGAGTYSCNSESSIPTEYDFVLTKTGDDNKNYNAELTIEGFAPVTLSATFDGKTLSLHVNDVVFDEAAGLVSYYNGTTSYDATFKFVSEYKLSMNAPLSIGVKEETTDENGEPVTKYSMEQWYMDGMATREGETAAFNWAGTWTVVGKEMMSNTDVEFDMVIEEKSGSYFIVSFLGNDVSGINYGGILVTPSADGKSAEIKAGTILKTVEAGVAYQYLYDMSVTASPIQITVNEDGTISIADFAVSVNAWGGAPDPNALVGFYSGLSASKAPEVEPFDWTGTWTVKAGTVDSYDGKEYASEFEMVVTYREDWDMYLVTNFMGYDVTGLNSGGILLTPSADNTTAELKTGTFVGGSYPSYLKMYDMNATTSPLTITVNADGTLSIANFFLKTYNWDAGTETAAVYYQGVSAFKGEVEEEPEVEPFDWTGTWTVKAGTVDSYDGKEYASEFEMVVTYREDWDMYLVTNFMGNDVTGLNSGGILLTPSADNTTAELKTGTFVGGSYPNYLKMYDMNATTSPLAITANADGTLAIANFFLKTYNWDAGTEAAAVYYQGVTASKADANAIESVEAADAKVAVNGGVITVAGEAQFVQVYDVTGRLEFSGVASSISNLAKGIHIVKVGGASVKVSVK